MKEEELTRGAVAIHAIRHAIPALEVIREDLSDEKHASDDLLREVIADLRQAVEL